MLIQSTDSIFIKGNIDEVFALANDLEQRPKIFPSCRALRVLNRDGDKTTFEVTFSQQGRVFTQRSTRTIDTKNKKSVSHVETPVWPIKSMMIEWLFEEAPGGTRLMIINDFRVRFSLLGYLIGRFYILPSFIDKTRRAELEAMKMNIEKPKA